MQMRRGRPLDVPLVRIRREFYAEQTALCRTRHAVSLRGKGPMWASAPTGVEVIRAEQPEPPLLKGGGPRKRWRDSTAVVFAENQLLSDCFLRNPPVSSFVAAPFDKGASGGNPPNGTNLPTIYAEQTALCRTRHNLSLRSGERADVGTEGNACGTSAPTGVEVIRAEQPEPPLLKGGGPRKRWRDSTAVVFAENQLLSDCFLRNPPVSSFVAAPFDKGASGGNPPNGTNSPGRLYYRNVFCRAHT